MQNSEDVLRSESVIIKIRVVFSKSIQSAMQADDSSVNISSHSPQHTWKHFFTVLETWSAAGLISSAVTNNMISFCREGVPVSVYVMDDGVEIGQGKARELRALPRRHDDVGPLQCERYLLTQHSSRSGPFPRLELVPELGLLLVLVLAQYLARPPVRVI